MKPYIDLINFITERGEVLPNRTGINTRAIFGYLFEHDMRTGFPLLTTKKVNLDTVAVELEGFIRGITDKAWYQIRKCFIWDEWCNPQSLVGYDFTKPEEAFRKIMRKQLEKPSISKKVQKAINKIEEESKVDGYIFDPGAIKNLAQLYEPDLGPIYGYQWRSFGKQYSPEKASENQYTVDCWDGVDQLAELVQTLKDNPFDRRMLVSAWNPIEVKKHTVALPACHWALEVYSNGTEFDLMWHQRSVDTFLGLPFNIASYGLLMKLLEKHTGKKARYLKGCLGNTHIYDNHTEQCTQQVMREPRKLPILDIPGGDFNLFDWTHDQYTLTGYDPHPAIKGIVAV